jgi:carotenoid cleavage dioxygenase-like enzyme
MTAHPKLDPVSGEMLFFGYSPFPPCLPYYVARDYQFAVNQLKEWGVL